MRGRIVEYERVLSSFRYLYEAGSGSGSENFSGINYRVSPLIPHQLFTFFYMFAEKAAIWNTGYLVKPDLKFR
jgi:hypothetical protein